MRSTGTGFTVLVGLLGAIVGWGVIAYAVQLRYGLGVTGLRDHVMWGLYITNFVFFIGISHAGTLISAILRVTNTEWRRPITRLAEGITVFALMVAAPMVLVDLGRPDRILNIVRYGRLQSPILWDVMSITTYLTGSLLYLYLPLIPDLAILHRLPRLPAWKRRLYKALSLSWLGTERQRALLGRGIATMAIIIIPVAVSVHTVVSWIFGMTLRAGWNSTIFGPYFVIGAIFSGIAAVVVAMAAFRKAYRLEAYITESHFRRMGYLLLALALIYGYFTFSEYLTPVYKMATAERGYLMEVLSGRFAPLFYITQIGGVLLPLLLLTVPRLGWVAGLWRVPLVRPAAALSAATAFASVLLFISFSGSPVAAAGLGSAILASAPWIIAALAGWLFISVLPALHAQPISAVVTASLLVTVGAWLKRFVIIVPTLQNPFLPIQRAPTGWAIYWPTWVEWSITAAAFAGFVLIYILFSKVFPIVSIWETREEGVHVPVVTHGGVADAPAP
ncbi:MAG: polysulfide reductase NrfD [Armatimonadetes bacterium]|nr:polysulfide reductase NrfD [Armatimonadota bacterium]